MNTYEIEAKLDAVQQKLCCHVLLTYQAQEEGQQLLTFYLNHGLAIQNIICHSLLRYEVSEQIVQWSPFVQESKEIRLYLGQALRAGESLAIQFSYEGYIPSVTEFGINRISEAWIELGLYAPWFPLAKELQPAEFVVKAAVGESYVVLGERAELRDGTWAIRQETPHVDCTLLAMRSPSCISVEGGEICAHVYYMEEKHAPAAEQIAGALASVFACYRSFGAIPARDISFVILPREEGGGYCRPNLIVLCADERLADTVTLHHFLAHEMAHVWWSQAADHQTWEDWLNESFAEYAALKAVQCTFGETVFQDLIQSCGEQAPFLPPIWGMDRSDTAAREVLYKKGPWLLYMLEQEIGESMFFHFLQQLRVQHVQTTAALLTLLAEVASPEAALQFQATLQA